MLKIGIIDDCVGIFPTYYKLKQAVSADFICIISDVRFTDMPRDNLIAASYEMTKRLTELGCDAIVLSSVSLSSLAYKKLQNLCGCPLYSSDAPVLHASTYTASGVLVAGNGRVVNRLSSPTVIPCAMDEFPLLAESGNERVIVEYVEKSLAPYDGKFDCIALADSAMNAYKRCFSRACPNVQIFDSLEGVARIIRKKYKKSARDECSCIVIDRNGVKIDEKYALFLQ